jgi:hypothetical protein
MTASEVGPSTRFGRLEQRGVLLGLSATQLVVLGFAVLIAVTAVYSAGMPGLVVTSPGWVTLLAASTLTVAGRPAIHWLPLGAQWGLRSVFGVRRASATVAARRDATLDLPGLPGRLEIVSLPGTDKYVVLDHRGGVVVGIFRVSGTGFVLDDVGEQEHKLASWGRALAATCQQPAIVRVQVLVRTRPGGLGPARRWWRERCAAGSDGLRAALSSMLDEGFVVPHRREAFVAVAVRVPRRRPSDADLQSAAKHLESFRTSLASAGPSGADWIDGHEIARTLRAGYEPSAVATDDQAPVTLGPATGVREEWSRFVAGSTAHATYWVSEWPRSDVHPAFLQPLLLGDLTDTTFTLIAEPLRIDRALREIRRAKFEHAADAAQRARIGQLESESTRAEVADLQRREAELVAGHGDLRFTGLLVVSASDDRELEERCIAMESAAARAMCEVRRLVGQQGLAHAAAALPLARGVL